MSKKQSISQQKQRLAYLMTLPTFLLIFIFITFPVLYNIWLSFRHITLGNLNQKTPWVGLANYLKVLKDLEFYNALKTSLIYSIGGSGVTVLLGLVAALILNQTFRGRKLIRATFLFTYIAPLVSLAFIWKWIFNPVYGVGNWILKETGIISQSIPWFSQAPYALIMIILFEGWRYFPFAMLLILARLQAIPQELYDAASIDGARKWHTFFYITFPEIKFVLGVAFLLRMIWAFHKFDDIFLLTSGASGTKVLSILIYEYSFSLQKLGLGAAASLILFLLMLTFLIFYLKKVLKW
ncbi:MAG: carbohydrate ABC transporter permease [Candidatus Aminicenantia bacterium]